MNELTAGAQLMNHVHDAPLEIDPELLRKYGGNGPRYTSYPTADRFVEAFDHKAYAHWLANRRIGGFTRPLGLYVHVPFCDTVCFYCACNKIAAKGDRAKATRYVDYLLKEMKLVAAALGDDRRITRMHWGGGTPTFLPDDECTRLVGALRSTFDFAPDGEYAIEIDPRKCDAGRVRHLAGLGFNRMSVGVQDFDRAVQKAVNRIQSVDETTEVMKAARESGFKSLNMDLIYGLPKQTLEGFNQTLDRVIEADPDRIALYSYAHLPSAFMPQRRILEADLPSPEVKFGLMMTAIRRLEAAGFTYIGFDHFAKPGDELAVAQRQGRLTRDFQGYSTGGDADLVGLGVSSISRIGPTHAQNEKTLDAYYGALDEGRIPTLRGIELTSDDLVRRAVIQSIACHFTLSKESISLAYLIDFDTYFAQEMKDLQGLVADGLVELEDDWILVTPKGRLLVRQVCMVFDKYLRATVERGRYSRVM